METVCEMAAHPVGHLFTLYFVYFIFFISQFGFTSGIRLLIASVPVHCYSIKFKVKVCVHKGSIPSQLLFIIALDALSHEFRTGEP